MPRSSNCSIQPCAESRSLSARESCLLLHTKPGHLESVAGCRIGPHRIMFGTDWSATWRWISVPTTLHKLRLKVLDDAKVTDEERRMILWDNAVEVFKLGKEAEKARSVFRSAAE
jgi:amidohydrolase family protein